jgi:hypothetical protein
MTTKTTNIERVPYECRLCGSTRKGLSIVWSVSYGASAETAEQVVICDDCRKFCDECGQPRVDDETHTNRESGLTECERCRLVRFIANDLFARVPYHKAELARWAAADAAVAYQGERLLAELTAVEAALSQKGSA